MPSLCLYFQVHQPVRLNRFSVFNIGSEHHPKSAYFDNTLNQKIFEKVAYKCYLPTNHLMYDLIKEYNGQFKISYSITGTFVEFCEQYMPEVLDSFKDLKNTGCVDFIDETYYHSLCGLYDDLNEFEDQVRLHQQMLKKHFNHKADVFRNTECIYDNRIAQKVADLGYKAILTEGSNNILGWRSPNYLYNAASAPNLKVLMRNYQLSDDVGFRFSSKRWPGWPLTADKYSYWLSHNQGDVINLFMDYETFGEHQWNDTGIFDFLRHLPGETLKYDHLNFLTVSEACQRYPSHDAIDVPWAISWADEDRNVSTWLGNDMQVACFEELKALAPKIKQTNDPDLLHTWRLLQTSDHLYYCSTKGFEDGNVHAYFSPYDVPYDGFINYMNVIQDLKDKVE